MKKSAFTMIELIFVIVILGVLAAVSLTKLAATRDDAKVAARAHSIMTAAFEIGSYAVAKGETKDHLGDMSASIRTMVKRGVATDPGNHASEIKMGGTSNCVTLKIEGFGNDVEDLVVEYGTTSDSICARLQSLIDDGRFPIPLRGSIVSF